MKNREVQALKQNQSENIILESEVEQTRQIETKYEVASEAQFVDNIKNDEFLIQGYAHTLTQEPTEVDHKAEKNLYINQGVKAYVLNDLL